MEQKRTLHDVPLFTKLSPAEIKLVTGISRTKKYKRNQIIFLEGEQYTGFYVLLSGSVKVYRLKGNGEEIVISRLAPYKSFAESPIFSGQKFYSSCSQSVDESAVLFFPADEFTALLARNPALAIRLSEASTVKIKDLDGRAGLLSSAADEKVAKYLLNEIELNNSIRMPEPHFNLLIHKKDLASYLGMASETLSRTLKKFKQDKVIREVTRKVFVTDLRKLRRLAGE